MKNTMKIVLGNTAKIVSEYTVKLVLGNTVKIVLGTTINIVTDQQPRIPSIHLSTHPLTGHSLHTHSDHPWLAPARHQPLKYPSLFFDLFVGHLIEHVQISIPPSSWYLGLLMDSNLLTHYPGYPFTCAWTCASIHCSPLLATIHSGPSTKAVPLLGSSHCYSREAPWLTAALRSPSWLLPILQVHTLPFSLVSGQIWPLHNVHIVQFEFLPTKQAETEP